MSREISLDSPYFLPCNFQFTRIDPPKQQESPLVNHLDFISPQLLHPRYQLRSSHPKSPWSPFHHAKFNNELSPGLDQAPIEEDEGIDSVISYSNQENHMLTPMKCEQPFPLIQQEVEHTTGKKSELSPQFSNKISKPRQKGLRKLSQKAFEIVQILKNATYKEVATRLVEQMSEEELGCENKQEQNIKRRVYDALNVLIALGVLKKDGRKIICEKDRTKVKSNNRELDEIESLKHKLAIKEQILMFKQKKLKQVEQKAESIKFIIMKNREKRNWQSPNIHFPFIGFMHHQGQAQTQLSDKGELTIHTAHPVKPFGDIDSLKHLKQWSMISEGNVFP